MQMTDNSGYSYVGTILSSWDKAQGQSRRHRHRVAECALGFSGMAKVACPIHYIMPSVDECQCHKPISLLAIAFVRKVVKRVLYPDSHREVLIVGIIP